MARVSVALGLAIAALVVAIGFTAVTLACGYRQTSAESSAPGQTGALQASGCVPFVHPMEPSLLLAAALVLAAIIRDGGRATAVWVGSALAVITLPWFSLGLVGTLVGLLLLVAGLRVPRDRPRGVAPGPALSLALVGATTVVMFWIAPAGPGEPWLRRGAPILDLAAAAIVLALLSVPRGPAWARVGAAGVGVAIFGWEVGGFVQQASSNVFAVAFLLVAGMAALFDDRARAPRARHE